MNEWDRLLQHTFLDFPHKQMERNYHIRRGGKSTDVTRLEQKAPSEMKRALLHIQRQQVQQFRLCRLHCVAEPQVRLHLCRYTPVPRRRCRRARQACPTGCVMDGEVAAVPHPERVYLFRVTFHQPKGSD